MVSSLSSSFNSLFPYILLLMSFLAANLNQFWKYFIQFPRFSSSVWAHYINPRNFSSFCSHQPSHQNRDSLVAQAVKASARNVGDPGSIPRLGRSPGEGNRNPLQYSYLENSMIGGAWWATWGHKESDRTEGLHFTSHQNNTELASRYGTV